MFSTPVSSVPEIPIFPRNIYDNMECRNFTYQDIDKALKNSKLQPHLDQMVFMASAIKKEEFLLVKPYVIFLINVSLRNMLR